MQYSPFISDLVITQIWIEHGHFVAPELLYHRILQRNYRKMTIAWSFSYNSFVKLSIYNVIQFIPMDPKHSVIKGLHCSVHVYSE